jgi:DNA-binding LytR/AlgR family response regulator
MSTEAAQPKDGLSVLVVDDEAPALNELAWLLRQDERVAEVRTAPSGADALRALDAAPADVVFCDISMPGLDGLELARVLGRFVERPQIVFVTAHEKHAVDAFEVSATDYLVKPIREERLAEAVRRVVTAHHAASPAPAPAPAGGRDHPGRTRRRDDVRPAQRHHLRAGPGRLRPAAHPAPPAT